jgi:hypothetical protein
VIGCIIIIVPVYLNHPVREQPEAAVKDIEEILET